MATTTKQDQNFIAAIVNRTLLEDAIEWIRENMEPEDVFGESALKAWAESAGYTTDQD